MVLYITLKNYSYENQYKWSFIINTKDYNILSKGITKTAWTCPIKCYSITTIYILTFITNFYCTSCTKQASFNKKLLDRFLANNLKHRPCRHLKYWQSNKVLLLNCVPVLYLNYFILGEKALYNDSRLDLKNSFDFQAII